MPHIIITKLASLIRLSIFQLRNNKYLSPIPISPSLLKEKAYKIKTKFKYLILHNQSKYVSVTSLFYITIFSSVLWMLYHNMCLFVLSSSKDLPRLPTTINHIVLFTLYYYSFRAKME